MFSFGQFAHLLPYLLVAVTSLIGWSSYAMANHKAQLTIDDSKEVSINKDQLETDETSPNLLELVDSDMSLSLNRNPRFSELYVYQIFEFPPGLSGFYHTTECLNLFEQRPPPSIKLV